VDVRQHPRGVDVADHDRHRHVKGEREEVRPRGPSRQVGPRALVRLLLRQLLVPVEHRPHKGLVDAGLDVNDRELHGGRL
jgi:hypothetical protein